MIWCTCIKKIRDNNNIITEYEIADMNGEHKIVSKEALKNAISNGQVGVVNLKLSKDGKLVDRATSEQAQLMKKLNINTVTEADNNKYLKARMVGVAPVVDEYGKTTSWPDTENIAITPNIKYVNSNCNLFNKTLIFYGNNEVRFAYGEHFKKAIIQNPTLVTAVASNSFTADTVIFDFDNIDTKIIDIIFKIYKSDNTRYRDSREMTILLLEPSRFNCDEVYEKTKKILARQKPSSKNARRCYDLVAYLRLIYSMYVSFGNPEIVKYANDYIVEYLRKKDDAIYDSDTHREFLIQNDNKIRELITKLREVKVK